MSTIVSWNGTNYTVPATAEQNWSGTTKVDGLLVSLVNNGFQKTGGLFTLSADVDFGATAGVEALYFRSRSSNVSSAGNIRLASADTGIGFRNAANSGNLIITTDGSDNLLYNGTAFINSSGVITAAITTASTISLTGTTDSSSTSTGILQVAGGVGIAKKLYVGTAINLGALTASVPVFTDASKNLISGTQTGTGTVVVVSASPTITGLLITAAVTAVGASDTVQLTVTGNATQTSNIFVVQKSDATKFIQVANSGVTTMTNILVSGLSASQAVVTDGSKNLTSLAYTSANTASALVQRDGSNNFSAGTITAALTGTASGNTAYTANQYGVVLSGSGNTMSVLAPDASTTKVLTSGGSSANPSWATVASAPTQSYELNNLGLSVTVAANACTIALKQGDGSTDPASGTGAVNISFRSATATTASYTERSITAALSVVIPSATTIGTASGISSYIYVYAIDNAGTVVLAVSLSQFDQGSVQSSSAISGGTSVTTLYSTSAQTSKAIRLLGRFAISEATAGTWATGATEVSLTPFDNQPIFLQYTGNAGTSITGNTTNVDFGTKVVDSHNAWTGSPLQTFTAPRAGMYCLVGEVCTTAGIVQQIELYKNGSDLLRCDSAVASTNNLPFAFALYLASGDTVTLRIGGNCTLSNSANQHWISIFSQS